MAKLLDYWQMSQTTTTTTSLDRLHRPYITPALYYTGLYYTCLLLPTFNLTTNHGQNYRYFRPYLNIVHSLNKDLILSVFLHACFPESKLDSIVIFFRRTEQRSRGSSVTSGGWGQEIGKEFQCLNDLWYFSRVWEMIQEADSVFPCSVTRRQSASVLWWLAPCHPFSALQWRAGHCGVCL